MADKRASHIIPKFMTKSMLKPSEPGAPRRGYVMGTYGKKRFSIVQDSPKQDYILCTRCESRFEKVETYTARKFFSRFRNPACSTEFPIDKGYLLSSDADIMNLIQVNRGMMRLLVYSILWRASICSVEMYNSFKLDAGAEEIMRKELNEVLADTEHATLENCVEYSNLEPVFPYVMLTSSVRTNETNNMIASFNLENGRAILLANEFMLQFFLADQVASSAKGFNINAKHPEVGMFSPDFWHSFVSKMGRMAAEHRRQNMGEDA